MPDESEETQDADETKESEKEEKKKEKKEKKKKDKEKAKQDKKKEKQDKEKGKDDETKTDQNTISRGKAVTFLIATEFCERLYFHGIRVILFIYLSSELSFSKNVGTRIFHGFLGVAYSTPIIGAIISDSWLGKFRTILYIYVVYISGNILMTIGSAPNKLIVMRVVSLVGLFITSIGSGCTKPCSSAFGGDQFIKGQEKMRLHFFSAFYFATKCGNLIGTIITPFLKGDVNCFNKSGCFPLAFIVITLINIFGMFMFFMGSTFYIKRRPEGSIIISVLQCIYYALHTKATHEGKPKLHWLDYAEDRFDKKLIRDIKCFIRLLFLYVPLPIFWALFLQKGSRWVYQGTKMNTEVKSYFINPEHMQLLNPLLVILMIPLFDWVIYPLLKKRGICETPLQRMTVGGLLCALSFMIAAGVEIEIGRGMPELPMESQSRMHVINNSPCHLQMKSPIVSNLTAFGQITLDVLKAQVTTWRFIPGECVATSSQEIPVNASETFLVMMVTIVEDELKIIHSNDSHLKLINGYPRMRLLFSIDYEFVESENASFLFRGEQSLYLFPDKMERPGTIGMTEYCALEPGIYEVFLPVNGTHYEDEPLGKLKLSSGGSYSVFIFQRDLLNVSTMHNMETISPNTLHLFWQVPQYIVLTAGEVMFTVTGLEFSYSQAPVSLKSVVQALWLLCNALGNVLIILLNFITFTYDSTEFFMYAALMIFSMFSFALLGCCYRYVRYEEKE
ncbi:solute carrier family 15 member 2 [Trichonephila clavata]|uniref:Solute carrier family 15 member 2 n=1 Tax=Trichonephila clavata TaxID=2740835 RepID=A0A8X6L3V5_TRICU|nr:solute carrier family 15 member 2 [Trichonephila clavata]